MKVEYLDDGSYHCPVIRLFGFDEEGACHLKSVLNTLAAGQAKEVVLTDLPEFAAIGGCRLSLKVSPHDWGIVPTNEALSFEYLLSREGWITVSERAASFCRNALPGHYQWLDETGRIALLLSPNGEW